MKLTEQQYELIEAYLSDELSAIDRASFEVDLNQNPELKAAVEIQREVRLGFRALAIEKKLQQARNRWQTTNQPSQQPATSGKQIPFETNQAPRRFGSFTVWAAAASVIVLVGISLLIYQQRKAPASAAEIAFNDVYRPDPSTDLIKSFPADIKAADRARFQDVVQGYKAGKYDAIIKQLNTLPTEQKTVHYKNYFLGLSYLAKKQPTKAIPYLTAALKTSSLPLRQKAEWFRALAYLKKGDKATALPLLQRIDANKNHPFNEAAKQVISKIKE